MSAKPDTRTLAVALADAESFRQLCDGTFHRWEIAGSVRRKRPVVGDVEHVVIPKIDGGVNLLWQRLNEMLPTEGLYGEVGTIEKAVYSNGTTRWGDKYRGVLFRGFKHEVFTADATNWGAIFTIRTGPWEFSKRMVTLMQPRGYRQQDGYVRDANGIIATPDEQAFFRVCGVDYMEPEART